MCQRMEMLDVPLPALPRRASLWLTRYFVKLFTDSELLSGVLVLYVMQVCGMESVVESPNHSEKGTR